MWREYTRETPAKPGWAIASAGAALALTTGLAWVLAHQGFSSTTLAEPVAPPYWPVSLSLPQGAKPLAKWNNEELGADPAGNAGVVAYSWDSPEIVQSTTLVLAYKVVVDDDDSPGLRSRSLDDGLDDDREIDVGPMSGRLDVRMAPDGGRLYSAFARTDEGLALRIDLICPPGLRNPQGLFRGICRSVAFRDWYVSRDAQDWMDRLF
ncbi:MAG TPA: hypothetical protein VJZ71_02740 [Phycisphaerae bacterium]|nr:hypothetical protein [Phycisphaerae bacterium]